MLLANDKTNAKCQCQTQFQTERLNHFQYLIYFLMFLEVEVGVAY